MDALEKVIGTWRARGVALNEPASEEVLEKLATIFGTVPGELRRFYGLADGMPDCATDGFSISFWSIDRIIREHDLTEDGGVEWIASQTF